MLFIAQLFHYNADDIISCLSLTQQQNMLFEHLKCCFKRLVKQDIFALLTDQALTSEQLKLRFQQSAQQCSRPLLTVLYSILPQVSSIDAFVLFLQSLNPKYPHLFPVISNFANLASRLLCYTAGLGLTTHIFAPENKTLIPIDFDDYLRVFDDNEAEEEYRKLRVVAENAFEALLLKNVFPTDKVLSTTDIISIDKSSLTPSNCRRSSSSQLSSFGPVLNRCSSVSLTSSHATNLCHLSDKDSRSYVTTIQDAFLSRTSSELALQSASEFRLISNNLAIFSYAHRLYLNLLTPSDVRTRLDQLPQINNTGKFNKKKRLRNVLRTMTIT
ncbi:unnamed protein product [Adineta steineri]|uniref:Uncharacterized protein n=1 Tax=Adineta steineri TaxID=433720 RepID=A0A819D5W8_9BILA|nr:unnamed protein product [Adineta steineri]